MSDRERESWDPASLLALADTLRGLGYDIEPATSGDPPGGSIVARRDLGDRVVLLAVDAGGRFRAEMTWVVGEWPSRDEIAGVPVRMVDAVTRTVTVTGQVAAPGRIAEIVAALGTIVPWAGSSGPG